MLAVLTVTPAAIWSQGKKSGADTTPAPPKSKTTLEVREGSSDFGKWGQSLVIHSPEVLFFRWHTDQEGVAWAFWEMSDAPFSSSDTVASAQASHLVLSGQVGDTKRGLVDSFAINFAQFANHTPPESPKRYYVRVTTTGKQKPVGLPSPSVIITYSRPPGWQPPELGSEYCDLSVRHPIHMDRCSLRFLFFDKVDPIVNRAEIHGDHALHLLIKSAAAGKKYQVDCRLDTFGSEHKPYKIHGGKLNETVPQTGGMKHVSFTFESTNTDWSELFIRNEEGLMFFQCTVTNVK